jgi:hypothetical protein
MGDNTIHMAAGIGRFEDLYAWLPNEFMPPSGRNTSSDIRAESRHFELTNDYTDEKLETEVGFLSLRVTFEVRNSETVRCG